MLARGGSRRTPRRDVALAALHLFVLSSFALAQPLFELLSKNVVFFAARGSTRWDVIAFALGVTLVPPAVLLAIELVAALAGERARRVVHLVFVAVLSALVGMQALHRLVEIEGAAFVVAGLAVGSAAAAAYGLLPPVRSIVSVLAPVPFVFLGLFLLGSPVAKIAIEGDAEASTAPVDATAPVVVVVFDEFPSSSLMDARGRLDARRYPGFARLAGRSTWFRNATTVQGNTSLAVPAILTGDYPTDTGRVPIATDYPRSLFTFLGGSYKMNVTEAVTRVCPTKLCPREGIEGFAGRMESLASDLSVVYGHMVLPADLRQRLPSVATSWGNFAGREGDDVPRGADKRFLQRRLFPGSVQDRDLKFRLFVDSIRRSPRPALHYLHVLLPHYGWVYLPSGKRYAGGGSIAGLVEDTWTDDPVLVQQGWQRHLLQVAFVDRLIGGLVSRLEGQGLWDEALVVVTADHGVSFRPGGPRRVTTRENLPELAFVPLFVKAPGQAEGRIVDEHVETVDILPTLADALGVGLPWAVDGRSALSTSYRPRTDVRIYRTAGGTVLEPFAAAARRRDGLLAEQAELFGPSLFRFGPHAELVGKRVPAGVPADDTLRVSLGSGGVVRYDPTADDAPVLVSGLLEGDDAAAGIDLAVAVNGRIEAVTRSYLLRDSAAVSALVPESSLRHGENRIELFRVAAEGALARIPLAR